MPPWENLFFNNANCWKLGYFFFFLFVRPLGEAMAPLPPPWSRLCTGSPDMESSVRESADMESAAMESGVMESADIESAFMESADVESAVMESAAVEIFQIHIHII